MIRVCIREGLLKVDERVFVTDGTSLFVVLEVIYSAKDFTAEDMGLVIVGCPVVQRG
jgi:hypothetical protein